MKRTSAQIRREFIEFFEKRHGHAFVPSSPVVPIDDPTLMFTNAGMNQFKPIFLGQAEPGSRMGKLKRAVNSQKCIRAGGKHNDLDDVGKDTYHHTFFEMLGNWSFGDYFKREAIQWAWDLLTNVWGLEKKRLYATAFGGDAGEKLDRDDEAAELWRTVTDMDPTHVVWGNKKDNFWEMGETGPCGPCSEIHIDLTPDCSGGPLVNAGDPSVIEIWNLVFIQFNRGADGALTPLPARHVDTGMGFERITRLLQGKTSNYDTDIFAPIMGVIQRITGAAGYSGLLADAKSGSGIRDAGVLRDTAYRVIADHIRTLTFAIADGAQPGNEGRGYVLRRILRRAFRYGWQYLGMHKPFLCELVPAVVDLMDEAFPELRKQTTHVAAILRDEEESFGRTLERGITLFEEAARYATTHHHGRIKGEDAFKLHDTFGFPIDLTELMAEERGLTVDIGEYERLMEDAKDRSRVKRTSELLGIPENHLTSTTDDSFKYLDPATPLNAKYLFPVAVGTSREGFIFDRTNFYAEQGGQVGDSGRILFPQGEIRISSTLRAGNQVIHVFDRAEIDNLSGDLCRGNTATLVVDSFRRTRIVMNHSSTHLLNWALREVLGEHVQQKGSLVDAEKTRFDFSHNAALSDDELRRVETLVNERIRENLEVFAKEVPQADALKINGLRAVFGEKYPDVVRVVSIGQPVDELLNEPENPKWRQFSVEFCGGTHLKRTGEAVHFRLVEESAVARGIRRVTGVTGERADAADQAALRMQREADEAGKLEDAALVEHVAALSNALTHTELPVLERKKLLGTAAALQEKAKTVQKKQARQDTAGVLDMAARLLDQAPRVGGAAIVVGELGSAGVEQMRSAIDSLRARAGSAAVCLAAESDGKVILLAAMTPDVVGRGVKAGDLIKEIAPLVGGRGGGKPDIAQGGGADAAGIPAALERAAEWLRERLSK